MAGVEVIGNYNVTPLGNGQYSIALNNGNMGARIGDELAVEQLREKYNRPADKFEKKSSHKGAVVGGTVGALTGAAVTIPMFSSLSTVKQLIKEGSFAEKKGLVKELRKMFPKGNIMKALTKKVGWKAGKYVAIAAAIGAGIDISKPCGNMIVDIGGGTTDIAVISLGGSVVSSSIKVAGDKFDEYIVKYIKKRHNVMIGERTAEELKQQIGCVFPKIQDMEMDVRGRDLITGLPKTITIYSSEMMEALEEPAMLIVDAVHSVLEKTPPELAADISDKGIYMTGGGCLIDGLDRLLQDKTGINVMIAEDAISCVAKGTGKALDNLDSMDKMRK